jgi:sirohydrochlorin ferrochelatase
MRHPQLSAPELSGAAGGFRRAESDNAVLLVAHGSRNPQAAGVVQELAAALRVELGGTRVAVAYLDFTDPSVGLALTELADEGLEAWTVSELWLMADPKSDHPVDITETFPRKVAALKAHSSQTGHRADLEDMLRTWSGAIAARYELPEGHLAEAFRVITLPP